MQAGLGHHDTGAQIGVARRPQGSLLSVRKNLRANPGRTGLGAEAGLVPVDAMVPIDTFVQLFRLQAFCVIADVHHAKIMRRGLYVKPGNGRHDETTTNTSDSAWAAWACIRQCERRSKKPQLLGGICVLSVMQA